MARTKPSKSGRSGSTIKNADKEKRKYFPTGLRSLLKTIRKHWPDDLEVKERGVPWKEFLPTFSIFFEKMCNLYGIKPPATSEKYSALRSTLLRLETNKKNKRRAITFTDIRSYAEFVGEIPSGLFLLFSQCVSENGQLYSRNAQKKFLFDCERALAALRDHIDATPEFDKKTGKKQEPFVIFKDEEKTEYDVRLTSLNALVRGYKGISLKSGGNN